MLKDNIRFLNKHDARIIPAQNLFRSLFQPGFIVAPMICLAVAFAPLTAHSAPKSQNSAPDSEASENWQTIKETLYDNVDLRDGSHFMSLETPYRALDAAIVPVTLKFDREQKEEDYIQSVTFVIDENPSPIAAVFSVTPKSGLADLSTRVRIDKYTFVRAIAKTNTGDHFMVSNFVKAAGGCSAPGLAGQEAAMARLGKMKLKFLDAGVGAQSGKAQLLISHPNYSGLQFDQISRSEIPAHYVNSVTVTQDGETIFSATPDISVSEDPSIHFHYRDTGGDIHAVVTDTEGGVFEKTWSPKPQADG